MNPKQLLISSLAICGLLTGCLSEPDFQSVTDENGTRLEVQLFNEIRQQPATRVNDEGFCNGDAVGVYVVNYVDGIPGTLKVEDNQADNVKYTLDEATGAWTPETPVYYLDKKTKVDIYGYYPYAEPTDVKAYPFEIAKDQSRDAENGHLSEYESSDFLWAKADGDGEGISPTASKIVLTFNHIMAGVSVTLVEGEGFEAGEFATLEKSALVTNTRRRTTIDLSTGKVTAVGEVSTTGTIPYKQGEEFRAIVAPQTVAANTPLFSLTVDGMPYTFSKSEDVTYLPGKLHKFSIKIKKKTSGGVEFHLIGESITAWESESFTHDGQTREYIVINCETAGSLKDAITATGKDYQKVKNLKITGNINANDFFFMRDEMIMLQGVNLKEVTIEAVRVGYKDYMANEIPERAFASKKTLLRIILPDVLEKIGEYAFTVTGITGTIIFPEGLTHIGDYAFEHLNITSVSLPSTLKSIGGGAFSACDYLSGNMIFPDTLEEIHSSAFSGCDNLSGQLILPENLTVLGSNAFSNCGFTGSLKIPSKITKIENGVFEDCAFDGELILHDNIVEIGNDSFSNSTIHRYKGFRGHLNLPENLVSIGKEAFYGTHFSGKLVLPKTLALIGESAFLNCSHISGELVIPNEMRLISKYAFGGLSINSIILPSTVEYIASSAFTGCRGVSKIISDSVVPPSIANDAFSGLSKQNIILEVPESSVNSYSNVAGWNEFNHITAHHDFLISDLLYRTLNPPKSVTMQLKAPSNQSWRVENCPEWIQVSPSSGVGKAMLTLSISKMESTDVDIVEYEGLSSYGTYETFSFNGRRGEVVFLLEDKNYRTSTFVEQYDCVQADRDVISLQSATIGKGIDLIFMGDCFDAKDISEGKYLSSINDVVNSFFDIEPYKSYREYFNVSVVFGESEDSGLIDPDEGIRNSCFGCGYGITPNKNVIFSYAKEKGDVELNQSLIVLVINADLPYGSTFMWGDGTAIACIPLYSRGIQGIVHHEAGGHGFGKLADENIIWPIFIEPNYIKEIQDFKTYGFYENIALVGEPRKVPWSHLIFDSHYSNVVDIYEGGYYFSRGVFRSELNSCMNNNVPYYSAISREAIVKRIMEYAGEEYSFEKFKEKDVMSAALPETKSAMPELNIFYQARQQHGPIFMGEKPEFKKN